MQRPERRGQSAATPPNLSFSYYEGPTCRGSRGGDFRLTLTLKREGSVLRTLCRTTGALGVALGLMVGAARTAVAQKQFAFFGMVGGYFASRQNAVTPTAAVAPVDDLVVVGEALLLSPHAAAIRPSAASNTAKRPNVDLMSPLP